MFNPLLPGVAITQRSILGTNGLMFLIFDYTSSIIFYFLLIILVSSLFTHINVYTIIKFEEIYNTTK